MPGSFTWFQLGQITPVLNQYTPFSATVVNSDVFRLTTVTDWSKWDNFDGIKSFILIRFRYTTVLEFNQSISPVMGKYYPNKEPQIRTFRMPRELTELGFVPRVPEILLLSQWGNYKRRTANLIPWDLKLECLN